MNQFIIIYLFVNLFSKYLCIYALHTYIINN